MRVEQVYSKTRASHMNSRGIPSKTIRVAHFKRQARFSTWRRDFAAPYPAVTSLATKSLTGIDASPL
jgi:hypothetical protein